MYVVKIEGYFSNIRTIKLVDIHMLEELWKARADSPNKKLQLHHHYIKIINTILILNIYYVYQLGIFCFHL